MRNNLPVFLLVITFSFLNISCMHYYKYKKYKHKKESLTVISSVNDSKVQGWVHFHKIEHKKVLVTAEIKGLKPNKKYGFHIHQYGDCRENGKNAGGHLSYYEDSRHGSPNSEEKHMGDMGNLRSGKAGTSVYKKVLDICMYKIGGRSVIIHANEDDLKSQPSGNAGPYIGCGVIGYVKKSDQKKKEKETPKPTETKQKEEKETKKKETSPKPTEIKQKEKTTKIKKETQVIEIKEKTIKTEETETKEKETPKPTKTKQETETKEKETPKPTKTKQETETKQENTKTQKKTEAPASSN